MFYLISSYSLITNPVYPHSIPPEDKVSPDKDITQVEYFHEGDVCKLDLDYYVGSEKEEQA